MILGFTGTQIGMYRRQQTLFKDFLREHKPEEFHHGDCIGSDQQAHDLVRFWLPECRIIIHPPERMNKRAYCKGDMILDPLPFLVRNRAIVDASTYMVATPKSAREELRSGTWATIRYGLRCKKPVRILV